MPFLPFIPFLDCAEVVIQFTQQSIPWFLTLGFKFNTAVTLTDLQTLATDIDTWITNHLAARVSAGASIDNIKVTGLTAVTDPVVNQGPTTTAGTLTGAVLSAQAAMVVSFPTALRGRSYRGRNYVGGRVEPELQTVNSWTSAAIAAMLAAYLNLPLTVGPSGWSHVILSRFNNGARRTIGVATPVSGYVAKVPVATQRKRLS